MNTFEAPSEALPKHPGSPEEISRLVVEAAMEAPSLHNTQPWWFYANGNEIGLRADADRLLPIADPDGREMLISCGAALFTARLALRYLGFVPEVRLLPDPDLPNLIARIRWNAKVPPADYERELFAAIPQRRTHRGGFDSELIPDAILGALKQEAANEKAALDIISDESARTALAAIVEAGDYALRRDAARSREEAKWARGPGSRRRDGVPPTAYPAQPMRTEPNFPARDFAHGHGWGLPPSENAELARSAGVVAMLTTTSDHKTDWVNAGQALQRVLLLATSCGFAAALHSQPLEITQLRDFIKAQFCEDACPQMIIRIGATSETAVTIRRPVGDVLL